MNPIAVALPAGFLGTGRTTLLRHVLNGQHGHKIATTENEFGRVSVGSQLVGNRATQIRTLTSGYICCSHSNELEDTLFDSPDNLDKGNIQFDRLVIECTGMADPGLITQIFLSYRILYQRYLPSGVIALVDAIYTDEQMNQFTTAQSRIGCTDHTLLTKTDVTDEAEKLCECLTRTNTRVPVYTAAHGDIGLGLLFSTNGFVLEESVVSVKPRFRFIADKQNDISSIVVELDYPVDASEVFRVMENLLLKSTDKLLRYKGVLWIGGRPNRLLSQGVQRLYNVDWDRLWDDEKPHNTTVFIGVQLPEGEIRATFAGLRK